MNPFHYDGGSIITLVVLMGADCLEGGVFQTHESDGTMLAHPMVPGDAVCFVSHKYHNVTPVTAGSRQSFVVELWQGGIALNGR